MCLTAANTPVRQRASTSTSAAPDACPLSGDVGRFAFLNDRLEPKSAPGLLLLLLLAPLRSTCSRAGRFPASRHGLQGSRPLPAAAVLPAAPAAACTPCGRGAAHTRPAAAHGPTAPAGPVGGGGGGERHKLRSQVGMLLKVGVLTFTKVGVLTFTASQTFHMSGLVSGDTYGMSICESSSCVAPE